MKQNKWLIALLIAIFLISCNLPNSNTLIIGYINDAEPVCYEKHSSHGLKELSGYCGELKKYLEQKVGIKYNKIELIEIPSYQDRFKRYRDISVELGPSSITDSRKRKIKNYGGEFSISFYNTYTKLLVNSSKISDFKYNLISNKIGIIKGTTTSAVERVYSKTDPIYVTDRGDALTKLKNGDIDAYASDAILLESIKQELEKDNAGQFQIFPQDGFLGFESYGVVVYNDSELLDVINDWIEYKDADAESKFLNYGSTTGYLNTVDVN